MDDLLEPGESVVCRGRPGWRTATITIACGFSFAAALHLLVGVLDNNWTCPASLLYLIVMTPFGAILLFRTASARLIQTEHRLLYRRSRKSDVEEVALSDIHGATLSMAELLPSIRIKRRNGDDIFVKYVDRLEDLCERIRSPDSTASSSPRTLRGAFLIVLAIFGASFGLWLGLVGLYMLIAQEPTGTIKGIPEWRETAEPTARLLMSIAVALGSLVIVGPSVASAALGAWIGYLPALLASRLLVSADEASHLALLPRRLASILDVKEDPGRSQSNKRPPWIFKVVILWTAMWFALAGKVIAYLTDRLAKLLFGRAVLVDGLAAPESGN